jgi:hypothetical protein
LTSDNQGKAKAKGKGKAKEVNNDQDTPLIDRVAQIL